MFNNFHGETISINKFPCFNEVAALSHQKCANSTFFWEDMLHTFINNIAAKILAAYLDLTGSRFHCGNYLSQDFPGFGKAGVFERANASRLAAALAPLHIVD